MSLIPAYFWNNWKWWFLKLYIRNCYKKFFIQISTERSSQSVCFQVLRTRKHCFVFKKPKKNFLPVETCGNFLNVSPKSMFQYKRQTLGWKNIFSALVIWIGVMHTTRSGTLISWCLALEQKFFDPKWKFVLLALCPNSWWN